MLTPVPPKSHAVWRQTGETSVAEAETEVEEGRLVDRPSIGLFEPNSLDKARPALRRKTAISTQGLQRTEAGEYAESSRLFAPSAGRDSVADP